MTNLHENVISYLNVAFTNEMTALGKRTFHKPIFMKTTWNYIFPTWNDGKKFLQ